MNQQLNSKTQKKPNFITSIDGLISLAFLFVVSNVVVAAYFNYNSISIVSGDAEDGYIVYNTLFEFYPFYLTQHQDSTCRMLHFCGTSIFITLALLDPTTIVAGFVAGSVGFVMQPLSRLLHNGLHEMFLMLLCFVLCMRKLKGTWTKGLSLLAVGYGFAWVGHFFFEGNRPATFTYPSFSLAGDFLLWFDIAKGLLSSS